MSKKIGILTSSRADFGIYLPLLNAFKENSQFDIKLIVFGTHLSPDHGLTVNEIESSGFNANYKIYTPQKQNNAFGIADHYADYTKLFANFWNENNKYFDLVFALGDRYEMAAAVMASVPYGIKIAHIHAGETTLGAIDNVYRHCITLTSSICFTSTEIYKNRVEQLVEKSVPVYNVGSLSLEGIDQNSLPSKEQLSEQFGLDFSKPLILLVFHPETINPENNKRYVNEILSAVEQLTEYSFGINLPNTDTNSNEIRNAIIAFKEKNKDNNDNNRIAVVEHFGKNNFFGCLKHTSLLIGNSSSGIIEAASFGKYVLNLGDRQKGRVKSDNTIDLQIDKDLIVKEIKNIAKIGFRYNGTNIYNPEGKPSELIIKSLL